MMKPSANELRWILATLRVSEEAVEADGGDTTCLIVMRCHVERELIARFSELSTSERGLVPADYEHAIRTLIE